MSRNLAAALCALVLVAGCGTKEPVGPVAGELVVTLTSPGAADGAVLLRLVGPVDQVTAEGGYLVESAALSDGITRIVVVGTITSGPVARISIPDMSQASQYFGLVEEVADRGSFALLSSAGYSVSIAP
ncbi:MAG: hypothetical protein ABR602_07890 [Gemmatimonadales bacterium]